ncbi:methionyl-tRNA formyltransferase [Bombilactobacillus thymidiniphilus]|uniref:Methionyl-tRNA formyltransferase n=1 Tax=Bombilactobacillus thymidiniphilus TaxID=2923363 RepID=A0ABY4PDW5_9LACO|nr:methionyl-tRNA formyltransferase [Bombilactobacillus thymidiniphilus]UQS83457.1 methionyl-tRNA formyltransferase [Bombilactobacillus thymidiniphilus]
MTKIIFMGTPDFSKTVLAGLVDAGYEIAAVVTQPDHLVGRQKKLHSSPVKQYAQEHDFLVLQPEKISGSPEMEQLISLKADLIITAAFGQFLPTKLLNSAQIAAINVHGSLLPRNRGGAPIQRAIMNGDQQTGITIMYMAAKMDAGDMIAQEAIDILPTDTTGDLFAKLSVIGRDLLLQVLPDIIAGTNDRQVQDESLVTVTPNISAAEEKIDITKSALIINRQVRGLNPNPGAYLNLNGVRTKIYQTVIGTAKTTATPGTVVERTKKQLGIATGDQTVLFLTEIQLAGKSNMPIAAFLNGKGKDIQIGDHIID